MTPEEIRVLLLSIGVGPALSRPTTWDGYLKVFEQFAALVATKEREAIKGLCMELGGTTDFDRSTCLHLSDEISTRKSA